MLGKVLSFLFFSSIFLTFNSTNTLLAQVSSERDLKEAGISLHDLTHFSTISDLDFPRKSSLPSYTFLNCDRSEIWHLKVSRHNESETRPPKEFTYNQSQDKSGRKPSKELLTRKELKRLGGSFGVIVQLSNLNVVDPIMFKDSIYYPITSLTLSGDKAIVNLTIYDIKNENNKIRKRWIKKVRKFMTIDR